MNFKIKLAEKKDIDLLIAFINEQWEGKHIFTKSRKLFNWQYFNKDSRKYNFVIGICKKTKSTLERAKRIARQTTATIQDMYI